ncbi:hypothetical protein [Bacillus tuaregi]|uniref:hypothetical protein n=1 Tax=Bacillus tuaregi TaxID=1816695 RepID=UPI0008F8ABAB|nr:hypothetical protein [Bacillus tuaregi]
MLRLLLAFIFVLILLFQSLKPDVLASSQTFDNCMYLLNNKIQQDIESSYPVLKELKEKDSALVYKYNDLIKMRVPIGKEDSHLNSLIALFHGTSIGNRQLLIISDKYSQKWGNAFTGYVFYKEIDGTNVLLKIKRGDKVWEVVKQSRVRGKYITLEKIDKKCVRHD